MARDEGATVASARSRALARLLALSALTVLAVQIGLRTYSPQAGFSMVWPLSGVSLLWIATTTRRTFRLDLLALALCTAAPSYVVLRDVPLVLTGVAQVVAQPLVTLWVIRALAPGLWNGSGGRRMSRAAEVGVFLTGCAAGAVVSAGVRGSGLGLVPLDSWGAVLLVLVRNLTWVVTLGSFVFVLGPRSLPEVPGRLVRAWHAWRTQPARRGVLQSVETAGIALTTLTAVSLTYLRDLPLPANFLIIVCAVWAGSRLTPVLALLQPVVAGCAAVVMTLARHGIFVQSAGAVTASILAQGLLTALVVVNLTLSVSTEERKSATLRAKQAERTARQRAQLFSSVLEHMREGVLVVESPDRVVLRNTAAQRVLDGATVDYDADRVISVDRNGLFHTDGEPVATSDVPALVALRGESIERRDYLVKGSRHASGRIVEVTATPVPPVTLDEEPRALVMYRDVTAERQERDNLTSFAGVVAHDLQNPLAIATGWTEALLDAYEDGPVTADQARDMLVRVRRATGHMRSFIDDLLTYTIARDHPLRLEDTDLSAIAEHVAGFRREMDNAPLIEVQPGMEVHADTSLIRQVLDNLIGNACKYVAPGVRPRVQVTAAPLGDRLRVSIADNGIGIAEADRDRVFETFQRASKEYAGTGIGLAIVERIVSRHGGSVRALGNDRAPSGSVFVFDLPVATDPSRVQPPYEPSAEILEAVARDAESEPHLDAVASWS